MSYSQIKKKRKRMRRFHVLFWCIAVILLIGIFGGGKSLLSDSRLIPQNHLFRQTFSKNSGEDKVDLSGLYSQYAVLMDAKTGKILGEKQGEKRLFPASMTKIMTAVVVLEHTEDLGQRVTVSPEIFEQLYKENASRAGFEPGEETTIRDLLYGILLPSGAECCLACADAVAGSEEQFVALMNEKAKELGMSQTHFCNTTGLHERGHYTTAEDMAVLLRYALQNKDFCAVITSRRHSTKPSNIHPDGFTFYSTLFQNLGDYDGVEILGGKTGYTPQAGLCLASFAKVGGKKYILVTAKADGSHETEPFHILDAETVYQGLSEP